MLKNQQKALYGKEDSDDYYSDYNLKPRGASPLSREYSGIPITTNSFTYNSSVTSGIDLITGGTAINESLQLGSVGSNANNMSREHQTQHQRLTSAIRNFRMDNKVYPDSLSQLDLKSTFGSEYQTIIDNFVYTKKANTYTLYLSPKIPPVTLPISEVAGLTIKHHPWNEMIAGATPTIPDIYKLIPDDYFFIHFNNLKNYQELETTISDLKGPLSHVYGIGDSLAARDRILDKLGITKDTDLDIFLDEVVLMSYDFDGYPATDYALILKLKSTMLNNFVSNYVTGPASNRGEVGDYYVVATNEQLFKHIKTTADKPADSMATALDLKYSLTVLAEERDGLAFISDAFVEKITSPTYRINARRRNTVLKALETLQYSILAYKDITGAWPKNISTMIDENYLRGDSVYELNKYSINDQGVVSHQDWGSIYNVTPISQVKIDTVQVAEKDLYDNFREGYQQLWREFIDPVAVSILIGDQIRFHTIILPLIDSSEYNWIKNMVGSKDTELDFVTNPDRIPAIQLASHFDTNSILYAAYKANPREFDAEYSKCIKEYYQNRINDFTSSGSTKNTCVAKGELSEAEAILAVKTSVAELINWEGSKAELFSFMGDEVSLAASENVSFMINDLSNFDVYLGLEFSNPAEGKIFVEHLFDWVFEEIFGGETMSMGIFGIAPGKPIKNTYNNIEYYTLPTGWINLFYVFIDDRMYLTLSQNTINSLIDGKDGTK